MLPLKFCKMCFRRHMIYRFHSSDANAFRTFDREIPNCRAIRDGVMPALKAERTAFSYHGQWNLGTVRLLSFFGWGRRFLAKSDG